MNTDTKPKDILCNKCGNSCRPNETKPTGKWQSEYPHGLLNAKVVGGYDSYHLLDMNQYTFSLCETCLRSMFMEFKIKPKIEILGWPANLTDGYEVLKEDTWENDQRAYEFRVWQDDGSQHQAYLNRICNQEKDCGQKAVYTVFLSDEFTEYCCCEKHKSYWDKTVNAKLVKFIANHLKPFL